METLLLNVERKFGLKKSKSSLKFLGRIKKPQLTWKQRADVISFLLHPAFGNGDFELASTVFDIPHQTIRTWLHENRYFGRWLPFAKNLKPFEVQNTIPAKHGKAWKDIPAEVFAVYPPLDLSKYEAQIPVQTPITFTAQSTHEGTAHISTHKKVALARKHNAKFSYIGNDEKRIGKCRPPAHPEQAAFALAES